MTLCSALYSPCTYKSDGLCFFVFFFVIIWFSHPLHPLSGVCRAVLGWLRREVVCGRAGQRGVKAEWSKSKVRRGGNEHQSRALCCLFSIIRANVCLTITLAKLMLKPSLVETCWTGFWYQGYGPPHIQHLLDVFLISRLQFCSYSANVILSFYL